MTPGAPEPLPAFWPLQDWSHTVPRAPYRWHVLQGGSGPDTLLLHGAGASSHSWWKLAPILAENARVTAPDLPGHGWTRGGSGRMRLDQMAADLCALMAAIGAAPRVIIGHSAGGALALAMAQTLRPAGIVVLNGALEDFRGPAGVMFPMMAKALALNPFAAPFLARSAASPGAVERVISATGAKLDAEDLALYRHLIGDRRHVAGTLSMMANWSLRPLARMLPEIDVPVLFLHGANDQAVHPNVARRAAQSLPNAEIEVLDGIGHLLQEEAPDLVADRIANFAASLKTQA